ncbi:hypothetical protein F4809DRAFT_657452 [Biscogniauxia mediterranea]|nr:hypothetical protein F4809DRAFT_657452 [Biscogniauxia mediterranea]
MTNTGWANAASCRRDIKYLTIAMLLSNMTFIFLVEPLDINILEKWLLLLPPLPPSPSPRSICHGTRRGPEVQRAVAKDVRRGVPALRHYCYRADCVLSRGAAIYRGAPAGVWLPEDGEAWRYYRLDDEEEEELRAWYKRDRRPESRPTGSF